MNPMSKEILHLKYGNGNKIYSNSVVAKNKHSDILSIILFYYYLLTVND